MIETLLIKPFLALLLITISCSFLGTFVLWKKMAYFGDGLSHSILLGLILGTFFNSNQILILVIFAIIFALLVETFSLSKFFSKDTSIAISSYFCIAFAIIINDLTGKNLDIESYILGDISNINNFDIINLAFIALVTIFYTIFAFKKLLLINISEDLAKIENIKINFWNVSFSILLALAIALSIKIVGILLMTALLVLPSAIARIFSSSAKKMMIFSLLISCFSAFISFNIANNFDLTISAVVIAILCLIFSFGLILKKVFNHA